MALPLLLPILLALCACAAPALAVEAPGNLLTEWAPGTPVVTDPCPDLYWECAGQQAYQVQCGRDKTVLWDTGRLAGPVTVAEYGGPALEVGRTYWWRVRIWAGGEASGWTEPVTFSYHRARRPSVRPHIRTFMNFGGSTEFAVANLDLTFHSQPNALRPDILSLQYSLLATMVVPSEKADALERFCVDRGLTQEGIAERMFAHFRTDTSVKLHVGAERAANPIETRTCPGWDPRNDRNGDGRVDEAEARNLVEPRATARGMSQARIPIYYWGPPRDDFVMNVSDPDYQRFVAEVYCPAQAQGFDGLYVDTMPTDVAGPGRSADVLEFPRPTEDPDQWLHAMQTMLAKIKTAMPDSVITANGWGGQPFVIDGTQAEGWLDITRPLSQFEDILARTVALDRRGKIQMIQYNPVFDPELSEFGPKVPIDLARDAMFGLASYYLVHGDCTYYAYGRHPYANVQKLWPAAAAVDIGTPEGDYYVAAESGGEVEAAGDSLLPFGDFETDADGDGNPDGWIAAEPVELDGEVKHAGSASARIHSDGRRIKNINKQALRLKPNTAYTLSCWIRTESITGEPGAQVYPYEFDGASAGMITATGTQDWRRYALPFTTATDGEGRISFRVYGATGTAWFDDIEVTEGVQASWKVLARRFTGALVLVRPFGGGSWEDTAPPIALPQPMEPLHADGSRGEPVTSAVLRNGEATVLVSQQ